MRKPTDVAVELWFTKEETKNIEKMAAADFRKRKPYLENEIRKLIDAWKKQSK